MTRTAIVVGAGPNGLAAAALLARRGFQVAIHEQSDAPGGAARSEQVLGQGFVSDLGAAGHAFGVGSPAFRELRLQDHGLEWIHATYPMAHPLPGREAAILHRDAGRTARELGGDGLAWLRVHRPVTAHPERTLENITGPLLRVPPHPLAMASLGLRAAWPNSRLARCPGWMGRIVDALVSVLDSHGVTIHVNSPVADLRELPPADAVLLDLTPRQILSLAGAGLGRRYRGHLRRWKYGMGVYKVDYLLDGPIPWSDPRTTDAGTVHLGGTLAELAAAEAATHAGQLAESPFVLLCQQSAADPTRTRDGKEVVWAYAHVPNGCTVDAGPRIDAQVERFAPGFRDRIIARRNWAPEALEAWNPNLVGGDMIGGSLRGLQQVLRPAPTLRPYNTGAPGLYICSSSTPPGAGVHGMAGWNAARAVLRDLGVSPSDRA